MKIKTQYRRGLAVSDYVYLSTSGDDGENGRLETIQETADNTCKALGRLIEWMSDRGMIDAIDISHIAYGYRDTSAHFVQETTK